MDKDIATVNLLDELLGDLFEAKQKEQSARNDRIQIENKIIAIVGSKEEGSQTTKAIHYKTRITNKLSRKVDWDKYDQIASQIDIPASSLPVKISRTLDTKKLKAIEEKYPNSFREISECITISPLKPQVTCELIEE